MVLLSCVSPGKSIVDVFPYSEQSIVTFYGNEELSSTDLYHMYIVQKNPKTNLHHLQFLQDWSILSLNQSDQIILNSTHLCL